MFQTMFDRLLALFMCVILLVVLISGAFSLFSIRSAMIDSRMEGLLMQAREIAFLASGLMTAPSRIISTSSPPPWPTCNGRPAPYMRTMAPTFSSWTETAASWTTCSPPSRQRGRAADADAEDMSAALIEVLSGREVQTQITHDSQGPVFTVAVPWIQDDTVLGAVFIHTSSQIIEAEYHGLLLQIGIGFAFAALAAIIGTAFYTRGICKAPHRHHRRGRGNEPWTHSTPAPR